MQRASASPLDPALRDHILALEARLLDPDVRKSPEALARLLADDFFEFTSVGSVCDRQEVIEALRHEVAQPRVISEPRVTLLADDVVFVTYRLSRLAVAAAPPMRSLRSSLWRRVHGEWQMAFHQGTPCAAYGPDG